MKTKLLALALLACAPPAPRAPDLGACVPYSTDARTDDFLASRAADYEAALARATAWLRPMRVDPVALRKRGIKGKKKLVELLDTWVRLHAVADEADKPALLAHIDDLAEVTRTAAYHDMLEVDDDVFKQDATSYLRAAYLLERLGLDTRRYRVEIGRAHARLDGHLPRRGPHQRVVFRTYYAWFGLPEPFPLDDALERGLIARRADPTTLGHMDAYGLTHEVFAPYDYGDDLDAWPFSDEDLVYLRDALASLVERSVAAEDPDLVAELVSCLRFVRAVDLPAYTDGLAYLLGAQADDGHWGDYPEARARQGELARVNVELHTTAVVVDALTIAFHPAWNEGVAPYVPPGSSSKRR